MRASLIRSWGRFFPNPGFYGWVVVAMGFACSALVSPGQSFAIALYLDPMMAEIGLDRVEISWIFAFATLAAAACLPWVGRLTDRTPSGVFLGGVLGLLGVSMAGLAWAKGALGLTVALFFLRLLGQGAAGLGTIAATVQWFRRYRGRALALVGLGYAFGRLVYPGLIYVLMDLLGWRGSLLAMAVVYVAVVTPIYLRVVRDRRPAEEPVDGIMPVPAAADPQPAEVSFTLSQALHSPVFWALLLWSTLLPLVHTAVIFHQVALFAARGWGAALVPPSFAMYAITGVLMTYLTGLILERRPSRVGLAWSLGLTAAGIVTIALPLSPFAGAMLYGAVMGLASGAQAAVNSILWPDYFGIEALGTVKGIVSAANNAATAVGPPIAAVLVAASGSFTSSLVLFAAACAVGAVLSMRIEKPAAGPELVPAAPVPARAAA